MSQPSTALARTLETRDMPDRRESRFTQPRPECPNPERWTSPDIEATEHEVIEGIGGLVRLLQPEYVLETGTHRGFMAESIGKALKANGHGRLDTVEIERVLHEEAAGRVADLPVKAILGSSLEFTPSAPIDFAWFDSGAGDIRFHEFVRFYPYMHERTIVGFHDSGTHHKFVRLICLELMKQGALIPIFLPTPRGVALCQVVPNG